MHRDLFDSDKKATARAYAADECGSDSTSGLLIRLP